MRRTILACVAVALVTGATTATAASLITSKDIKNGTVQNKDIKKGTISQKALTPEIQALLAQVRADGGIPGPAGPKGDKGDAGAPGANGAPGAGGANGTNGTNGAQGEPGVANLERVSSPEESWTDAGPHQLSVPCPGNVALGGGYRTSGVGQHELAIVASAPAPIDGAATPNGWVVEGIKTGTDEVTVRAHVICADVAP